MAYSSENAVPNCPILSWMRTLLIEMSSDIMPRVNWATLFFSSIWNTLEHGTRHSKKKKSKRVLCQRRGWQNDVCSSFFATERNGSIAKLSFVPIFPALFTKTWRMTRSSRVCARNIGNGPWGVLRYSGLCRKPRKNEKGRKEPERERDYGKRGCDGIGSLYLSKCL